MSQRPYIVGNWKMHGTRAMLSEARAIDRAAQRHMKVEVAVAPPYTLIHPIHREAEQIAVGAQDCHHEDGGAHTGDISAAMVADAGAKFVILGHSERRQNHGEKDAVICAKAESALEAGLRIILCCGESEQTRDSGKAISFVKKQLKAWAEQPSLLYHKYHWFLNAQLKGQIQLHDPQAKLTGNKVALLKRRLGLLRAKLETSA